MPQGWDFGVLGVNTFNMGIFNGAPLTGRISYMLFLGFQSAQIGQLP